MKGFWEVVLEPLPTNQDRFSVANLAAVIQRAAVSLRGWNYPHISRGVHATGDAGIQSYTDSVYGREAWIFHSSGLFVHRMALREDLEPQWEGTFNLINALWSMTEIWEFTKRLYRDAADTREVRVTVEISGLRGRRLRMDPQYFLPLREAAESNTFHSSEVMDQDRLVSDAGEQALRWSERLFAQLGAVGMDVDALRPHQERLLKRQF